MTSITREHLDLAARAAGRRIAIAPTGRDTFDAIDADAMMAWRPHLDIADAARLALKLNLLSDVSPHDVRVVGCSRSISLRHDGTDGDKARAYREAIVMCAAGARLKWDGTAFEWCHPAARRLTMRLQHTEDEMEFLIIAILAAALLLALAFGATLNRRVRELSARLDAVEYAVERAPVPSGPGASPMGAGGGGRR